MIWPLPMLEWVRNKSVVHANTNSHDRIVGRLFYHVQLKSKIALWPPLTGRNYNNNAQVYT